MRGDFEGIAFHLDGPEGAPVAVFVHGLGLDRRGNWDGILPALPEGFRTLAYDLPGHGDSAPPGGPVDLAALAGRLERLLDALGIARAALVGFSLGGMIVRRLAIDHPGRVGGLAILNSPHERDPEQQRLVEERARKGAGGPASAIDETLERWFTPDFLKGSPAAVARIREIVLACDPESYAAHRIVLAEGVKELIRPEPPIALPALVATCEFDSGSTPEMSRGIADEMPRAQLEIVPGLRHLGLIEQPGRFARLIGEFLERIRSGV